MDITKLRKNTLFVGRAATAIYLILDTLMKEKEVILPANICYAAAYPIIYSGNIPIFVDVDAKTGNSTYKEIIKKVNESTGAIIFPYMYGNVSKDIIELKKYCELHNIVLIEDVASAMGANVGEYETGTIGDYAVFSTGHAKIVDVGNGGILVTDNNIDDIVDAYNRLDLYNEEIENKLNEFSKEYRYLRNNGNDNQIKNFFSKDYRNLFIYRIEKSIIDKMNKEIKNLEKINEERKERYNLYIDNLNKNCKYEILDFEEGSNPWRLTIIVKSEKQRKELIDILLKNKLFVSDWYPCIGKSFSNDIYPKCEDMENKILNFSLTDDKSNILKICEIINNYFKGVN